MPCRSLLSVNLAQMAWMAEAGVSLEQRDDAFLFEPLNLFPPQLFCTRLSTTAKASASKSRQSTLNARSIAALCVRAI